MIAAKLRATADVATQQKSSSSIFLESLAARWQRGERGNQNPHCPLDDHELEQACRIIDEEDVQVEMEDHELVNGIVDSGMAKEREKVFEKDISEPDPKKIEKCHLVEQNVEKQMQEDDMLEEEDLSATVHESEPQAGGV